MAQVAPRKDRPDRVLQQPGPSPGACFEKLREENPLWGAGRIRDTLLPLEYDVPCEDTVRKYMIRGPRERSTTWLPFLRNHLDVSWAMDSFTVTTFRFVTMCVSIVVDHGRRAVGMVRSGCTMQKNVPAWSRDEAHPGIVGP